MKQEKKKYLVLGALILVIIICIAVIAVYYMQRKKGEEEYAKIQKVAKDIVVAEEPEIEEYVSPINFEELWAINEEIYAWIEITGTEIDYPILQREGDDSYYLNHTIEGEEGLPGSIYTEAVNSKDFTDFNTMIYGHNLKGGGMFTSLHEYEDPEFLKSYPYVYIYMPDRMLTYQIFIAAVYDDRHIMYSFDFSNEAGCQEYLDALQELRAEAFCYDESLDVNTDSKILTLSTCTNGAANERWLVCAVLIDGMDE